MSTSSNFIKSIPITTPCSGQLSKITSSKSSENTAFTVSTLPCMINFTCPCWWDDDPLTPLIIMGAASSLCTSDDLASVTSAQVSSFATVWTTFPLGAVRDTNAVGHLQDRLLFVEKLFVCFLLRGPSPGYPLVLSNFSDPWCLPPFLT